MEAEIRLGQFDHATWFPNSKHAVKVSRSVEAAEPAPVMQPAHPRSLDQVALDREYPVFADFVELWWRQSEVTWRHSTTETNRSALHRHLLPWFGNREIGQIKRRDVLDFRNHLSKQPGRRPGSQISAKTMNNVMVLLNVIMTEAALQYDFMNPCIGIKRLKTQRKDIQPFSLAEVQLIVDRVRDDYRNYFLVRFFTGMRTGEIHGLRWHNIDFGRRQILVRETWARGRTDYTKTDGSQRDIVMSDPVLKALEEQRKTNRISDYVFCTRAGGPLDTKNVTDRVWYPLLDHLRLARRRPYQCRHTAATLWLAAGENPEWIARQLGHASTEMLFKVYSRYIPNLTRHDGSAFDAMIGQSMSFDHSVGGDDA